MEKKLNVCFLQGLDAKEGLNILQNRGKLEAVLYLKEWDYENLNDEDIPFYTDFDSSFNYKNYIMFYNIEDGYLGLIRIDKFNNRSFRILSRIKNYLINLIR